MAIAAVIFDIGDVLEHNPRTRWQQKWAQRLGIDRTELERRLQPILDAGSVGAITLEEAEQRTARALGLDAPALRELMDDQWAEYVGTLNRELANYLAALRPRYRTGIVSNSFVGAREREQALYGFEDMCDVVVYSHEEGVRKPHPRIYRSACARLGAPPEAAVLLDDVPANVEGARAVGLHAIEVRDTAQAIRELERMLAS